MTDVINIEPTQLRDYAKALGWTQRVAAWADRLFVMRNEHFPGRELVFPMDADVDDFRSAMELAIQKFAGFHNTKFSAVIEGIAEVTQDVVRYRIHGERVRERGIPLTFAKELLIGAETIFLAAASTLVNPRIHHPRMAFTDAQEFLQKSNFGQTEQGSFVVKIACSVNALDQETTVADAEERAPFVRCATVTAYRAIKQLVNAIESDTLDTLVAHAKTDSRPTLSSNLCEALTHLHNDVLENALEIAFSWAKSEQSLVTPADRAPIRIQRGYFERIEEVGRELRNTEISLPGQFVGVVDRLNGTIGDDGKRSGEVILTLFMEAGVGTRVRVVLNSEQYATADKAHMNDGTYVIARGVVDPGRQPRVLRDLTSFTIMGTEHNPMPQPA